MQNPKNSADVMYGRSLEVFSIDFFIGFQVMSVDRAGVGLPPSRRGDCIEGLVLKQPTKSCLPKEHIPMERHTLDDSRG